MVLEKIELIWLQISEARVAIEVAEEAIVLSVDVISELSVCTHIETPLSR